jgi:hypothetical protein
MKKATRMLVLAASLTLLLALVATANAKPTTCKGNNPACTTTTIAPTTTTTTTVVPGSLGVGLSCAEYVDLDPGSYIPLIWDAGANGTFSEFEVTLTSGDDDTCIDISTTTDGSFTVDVSEDGLEPKRNSILVALIKDSHPGDHCGWIGKDDPRSALNLNLTNVDEVTGTIFGVPAANRDACGTGYADTSDPLAFVLFITGKRGITAKITLTYEADAHS